MNCTSAVGVFVNVCGSGCLSVWGKRERVCECVFMYMDGRPRSHETSDDRLTGVEMSLV